MVEHESARVVPEPQPRRIFRRPTEAGHAVSDNEAHHSSDPGSLSAGAGSEQPPQPKRRGLVFGASASLVAQIAGVGLTALTSVAIARLLGPAGTGTYSLLANLAAGLVLLSGFGMATGITLEVGRGLWSLRSALRLTQLVAVPLGLFGALLGLCFWVAARGGLLKGVGLGLLLAPLLSIPFGLAATFSAGVAVAKGLYKQSALTSLANPLLTCLCVVALTIPWGITGAVIGSALGTAGCGIFAAWLLYRERQRRSGPQRPSNPIVNQRIHLCRAFSLGVRGWGGDLLQFLNYRLDLFVVAAFASRASVGQYAVAVSLMQLGWLLPNAIANVFLPRAAALDIAAARGDISQSAASEASARVIRHTVALQVPTILGLSVVLITVLPLLFGAKFHPAIQLGFILIPGVVALSVDKVLSATLIGRGHTIYSLYSALATTPPTVLLYLILIPRWGAVGGAVASSISYALSTAVGIILFRHTSVAPLRAALVPRLSDLRDYQRLIKQGLELSWVSAIRSRWRRSVA